MIFAVFDVPYRRAAVNTCIICMQCLTLIKKYSVGQKNPPCGFLTFFPKRLGIFSPNFTCLLQVPIYARLQFFIQLSPTVTKLCHIKRDHPVYIICSKCPPSAATRRWVYSTTLYRSKRNGYILINRPNLRYYLFYQLHRSATYNRPPARSHIR